MTEPDKVWVLDTSALAETRRIVPAVQRRKVFAALEALINAGTLVYPRQVVAELTGGALTNGHDHPLELAKKYANTCARHEPLVDRVRAILADPVVARVLDSEKDTEEADPYVLALAQHHMAAGDQVVVLTEDARSRPDKLSLRDACGLLGIVSLTTGPYLESVGIWKRS